MNLTLPKNNIKEISRLKHLAKEYYNKIFKMDSSPIKNGTLTTLPTTLPPTTLPKI